MHPTCMLISKLCTVVSIDGYYQKRSEYLQNFLKLKGIHDCVPLLQVPLHNVVYMTLYCVILCTLSMYILTPFSGNVFILTVDGISMRWFLSTLSISRELISKREAGRLSSMLSNSSSSVTCCSLHG